MYKTTLNLPKILFIYSTCPLYVAVFLQEASRRQNKELDMRERFKMSRCLTFDLFSGRESQVGPSRLQIRGQSWVWICSGMTWGIFPVFQYHRVNTVLTQLFSGRGSLQGTIMTLTLVCFHIITNPIREKSCKLLFVGLTV